MPLISTYPPLSVLYHAFAPWLDKDTIVGHSIHHSHRVVNFGISPHMDALFGTLKMPERIVRAVPGGGGGGSRSST